MILVEVAGFLGADAEERFTSTGKRVVSLRVAARSRHAGKDTTMWWRVSIWGDRFDKMLPYLRKGSAVIVIGEMSDPQTYTAKDGTTQISLSMTAEMIKFSPFGKTEKEAGAAPAQSQTTGVSESAFSAPNQEMAGFGASSPAASPIAGDDLPF